MFDARRKSSGIGHTTTATFLVVAFIFNPASMTVSVSAPSRYDRL